MSSDPDRAEVLARLNARGSFLKEFGIALGLCYALIAVWGLIQFQQVLQLWWTLALFFFAIIGPSSACSSRPGRLCSGSGCRCDWCHCADRI